MLNLIHGLGVTLPRHLETYPGRPEALQLVTF
jgi:hypothetical protein